MALKYKFREFFRLHTGDRPGLIVLSLLLVSGVALYIFSKPSNAFSRQNPDPLLATIDTLRQDTLRATEQKDVPEGKASIERNAD